MDFFEDDHGFCLKLFKNLISIWSVTKIIVSVIFKDLYVELTDFDLNFSKILVLTLSSIGNISFGALYFFTEYVPENYSFSGLL